MTLKSKANIITDADTYLPDNTTEQIDAGDVRDRIKDIADSFLNLQDGGLVVGALAGYSTTLTPSNDMHFATKKYVDDGLSGVSPVWGSITGTVTDQTDLTTYLSTNYQPLATNLTSLSGLTYASTSFVKMTAAGTFALDTNTYASSSDLTAYAKLDGTNTPFTGAIRIEPTSGTALTLKGVGATSATNALSVKDSANSEYFTLRNDGAIVHTGGIHYQFATQPQIRLVATSTYPSYSAPSTLQFQNSSQAEIASVFSYNFSGNNRLALRCSSGSIFTISSIIYFGDAAANIVSTYTASTGNWNFAGSAQNMLTIQRGIKIGNNTDSAATATAGAVRYNTGLEFSNGSNWLNTVAIIKGATKTTAAAPYTNDGFITVTIEGVTYKLMTTA